jgi:hypothetical protein
MSSVFETPDIFRRRQPAKVSPISTVENYREVVVRKSVFIGSTHSPRRSRMARAWVPGLETIRSITFPTPRTRCTACRASSRCKSDSMQPSSDTSPIFIIGTIPRDTRGSPLRKQATTSVAMSRSDLRPAIAWSSVDEWIDGDNWSGIAFGLMELTSWKQ